MLSPVSMASVSRVHFGDSVLDRQGAYAKPAEETVSAPVEEKKSSAAKKIAIGAGIVIVALAALVGLTKGNVLKTLEEATMKETKWYNPKFTTTATYRYAATIVGAINITTSSIHSFQNFPMRMSVPVVAATGNQTDFRTYRRKKKF